MEAASLYETKAKTVITTGAFHGGRTLDYLTQKETAIRQEWKREMIHEGKIFNDAVIDTVNMDIWPTERMIMLESKRSMTVRDASRDHPGA